MELTDTVKWLRHIAEHGADEEFDLNALLVQAADELDATVLKLDAVRRILDDEIWSYAHASSAIDALRELFSVERNGPNAYPPRDCCGSWHLGRANGPQCALPDGYPESDEEERGQPPCMICGATLADPSPCPVPDCPVLEGRLSETVSEGQCPICNASDHSDPTGRSCGQTAKP